MKTAAMSLAWAALMALSAATGLFFMRDWLADQRAVELIEIFALGGLLAYSPVHVLLARLPGAWTPGQRFAAAFILLALMTIGLTAFLFALQFRSYFAQWHDHEWSRRYVFETVFTILSAIY